MPFVSLLDRPYELDVDKQPWPILLERTAAGLRDGQFEGVPESLDRLVVLRADAQQYFAPASVILDRLYELDRSHTKAEGPPLNPGQREYRWKEKMYDLLGQLPPPVRNSILSPSHVHVVSVTDVLAQVDAMIDQARPPRDLINSLPNEILILIGHLVLNSYGHRDREPSLHDYGGVPHREGNRASLTAVCCRWRAVFTVAEFWDELEIRLGPSKSECDAAAPYDDDDGQKTRKSRKALDAFLAHSAPNVLKTYAMEAREDLLATLSAMKGRSANLKYWAVWVPKDFEIRSIWEVWLESADCHLKQLLIEGPATDYGDASDVFVPWSFPPGMHAASLVNLYLTQVSVDLLLLSRHLPQLQKIELSNSEPLDPGGSSQNPVAIHFPVLRHLEMYHFEWDPPEWSEGVSFLAPELVDLDLHHYHVSPSFIMPRAPHPPYGQLVRFHTDAYQPEDELLDILRRHPTVVDVRLPVDVLSAVCFEALGRGVCPALKRLELSVNDPVSVNGSAVVAMVQAREEASARGEEITPLEELSIDDRFGLGFTISKEDFDWLSAHLRVHDGNYSCGGYL